MIGMLIAAIRRPSGGLFTPLQLQSNQGWEIVALRKGS